MAWLNVDDCDDVAVNLAFEGDIPYLALNMRERMAVVDIATVDGDSAAEIAARFGVTKRTVERLRRRIRETE